MKAEYKSNKENYEEMLAIARKQNVLLSKHWFNVGHFVSGDGAYRRAKQIAVVLENTLRGQKPYGD